MVLILKETDMEKYTIANDHDAVKALQRVVRYFNGFDEVRANPATAHFLNLITSVQLYIEPGINPNDVDEEVRSETKK